MANTITWREIYKIAKDGDKILGKEYQTNRFPNDTKHVTFDFSDTHKEFLVNKATAFFCDKYNNDDPCQLRKTFNTFCHEEEKYIILDNDDIKVNNNEYEIATLQKGVLIEFQNFCMKHNYLYSIYDEEGYFLIRMNVVSLSKIEEELKDMEIQDFIQDLKDKGFVFIKYEPTDNFGIKKSSKKCKKIELKNIRESKI